MASSGPTSNSYISQRLKLHYMDWGNEGAPPLLLIHGGRDHCRNWDWTAERLRDRYHIIAPDWRGHGNSSWAADGNYDMQSYIYDLAQLIHQLDLGPLSIVAHSMGGNIALRYTGLFPENVKNIVAIEGLGPSPDMLAERAAKSYSDHFRQWILDKRQAAGRTPRHYASFDEALARMKAENSHLTDEQARHLSIHGINRNEDGSWSWKFDNHLNIWPNNDISQDDLHKLWKAITCPTLLLYGADSWASNPDRDGRLQHFNNAKVIEFENAGHWLHHDQFERFIATLEEFL